MAFVFIAKLAAAAKEMLVAWRYGTSGVVDGYLYVYNLAQWPIGIWFSVLSVVLIPLVGRTRADKDGGLTKFRNELFGAVIIGGIILSVVVAVVTCTMLRLGITGLDGDALQAARDMALILATSAFFGALIAFFSTWVMAGNRHENTLFEGIPAVCIAVTVIIFSEAEGGALLWGTMVGVVLQATMQLYSLRWKKEMPIPRFTRESPLWGPFVRQLGIMFVGQALLSTTIIIDTVAAAHMGPGAIATL